MKMVFHEVSWSYQTGSNGYPTFKKVSKLTLAYKLPGLYFSAMLMLERSRSSEAQIKTKNRTIFQLLSVAKSIMNGWIRARIVPSEAESELWASDLTKYFSVFCKYAQPIFVSTFFYLLHSNQKRLLQIRLGQMMKVKILEKRVKLPYVALGDVTIFLEGTNIVVKLRKKGIKVR